MERPRLYLDEDVHGAVAAGLRRRGFEVMTTSDADRLGATDADQLAFAAAERRVLVTYNRGDSARLHAEYVHDGRSHAGVVVSRQAAVGRVVRALAGLLGSRAASDFVDRLYWLAVSDASAP